MLTHFVSRMQMLDRYVQESADNAHPSSHHSSENVDGEDGDADEHADKQSSSDSESSAELSAEQPEAEQQQQGVALDASAHLARLDMDDCKAAPHSPGVCASDISQPADVQEDPDTLGSDDRGLSQTAPDQDTGRGQDVGSAEQLLEDLPDHVAVRRREGAMRASESMIEAGHELDDDTCSVVSHGVQIPSQEAVQQRVVDQQRSRMRRQVLARASRNAQKVGNKRERKQTASSVNW